jgi:hypothetical protein
MQNVKGVIIELLTPIIAKKRQLRIGHTKLGKAYAYKTTYGREGEKSLADEISEKVKGLDFLPFKNPVHVTATFNRGRADAIGKMETILDAMEGSVYDNDRQAQIVSIVHDPLAISALITVKEIAIYDSP